MVLLFGFILGFFARMGGGKGTFKQALGVVSWAALIPFGSARWSRCRWCWPPSRSSG